MADQITLYTIGCATATAQYFFDLLADAGVRRVVDVRARRNSQLSAFAQWPDIEFFLDRIVGIDYWHFLDLATPPITLDRYHKGKIGWSEYVTDYERHLRTVKPPADSIQDRDCFLCSEAEADQCHRRLAAEYLAELRGNTEVVHL